MIVRVYSIDDDGNEYWEEHRITTLDDGRNVIWLGDWQRTYLEPNEMNTCVNNSER